MASAPALTPCGDYQLGSIPIVTSNYMPQNTVIWSAWNSGIISGTTYYSAADWGTPVTAAISTVWVDWNQQYHPTQIQNLDNYQQQINQINNQGLDNAQLGLGGLGQSYGSAEKSSAQKRAREALLMVLDKDQKQEYEKDGHFELMVNDRLYRVRPGARVERLNRKTKKVESYFCIHPELHHSLPYEDVAISQKLLLEAAEDEFLRIANETRAA